MDQELLVRIVEIVVLAIVGILALGARGLVTVGIKYLENKVGVENFSTAQSMVMTVVRAVEQSPEFSELLGSAKKEQVILRASQWLQEAGIVVSEEQLDKLIESAVQIMQSEYAGVLIEEEA